LDANRQLAEQGIAALQRISAPCCEHGVEAIESTRPVTHEHTGNRAAQ
jgi:hypothetical protein